MSNHNEDRQLREDAFARKIGQALDETLATLPTSRLEQLAMARKAALRAQKMPLPVAQMVPRAAFAGGATTPLSLGDRFGRLALGAAMVLLVAAGLVGIFHVEQQRRIDELAELDTALLTDEIPISAYADHGFNTYLKQNQ
ncbi:MAG: DUF3619 family protein [Burkholderiaceae bacterium]|jgi:hypothetical protein